MLHIATPIDQYAHLAADVVADLGQISRQLVGQKPVRLEPSLKEPLKLLDLTGLEASGVSVDLDGRMLQQPDKGCARKVRGPSGGFADGRKVGVARTRGNNRVPKTVA